MSYSKSQKQLKPIQERNKRSSMDYQMSPNMVMNPFKRLPNILVGESEGDNKKKVFNEEYKEYIRRSLERSNDRN